MLNDVLRARDLIIYLYIPLCGEIPQFKSKRMQILGDRVRGTRRNVNCNFAKINAREYNHVQARRTLCTDCTDNCSQNCKGVSTSLHGQYYCTIMLYNVIDSPSTRPILLCNIWSINYWSCRSYIELGCTICIVPIKNCRKNFHKKNSIFVS